jgi:hypothetical protein
VVSVYAGTKEGQIEADDIQGWKIPFASMRNHMALILTLTMTHFAEQASTVSFVQDFPGLVKSGIGRGTMGAARVFTVLFKVLGPFVNVSPEEVAERHLFYATSGRFPSAAEAGSSSTDGVAKGVDGKSGSGVYTLDNSSEEGGDATVKLLTDLRNQGYIDKILKDLTEQFVRITGAEAI